MNPEPLCCADRWGKKDQACEFIAFRGGFFGLVTCCMTSITIRTLFGPNPASRKHAGWQVRSIGYRTPLFWLYPVVESTDALDLYSNIQSRRSLHQHLVAIHLLAGGPHQLTAGSIRKLVSGLDTSSSLHCQGLCHLQLDLLAAAKGWKH